MMKFDDLCEYCKSTITRHGCPNNRISNSCTNSYIGCYACWKENFKAKDISKTAKADICDRCKQLVEKDIDKRKSMNDLQEVIRRKEDVKRSILDKQHN